MEYKDFVFNQLRATAAGVIARSKAINSLSHNGLKGTFREVLLAELIEPWLPPSCGSGTGAIICGKAEKVPVKGQDDIIIYDASFMPPILASKNGNLGFYLFNSVLSRVEVKTKLRAKDLKEFVTSSVALCDIQFTAVPGADLKCEQLIAPHNIIIALSSDLKGCEIARFEKYAVENTQYRRGMVSAICVLGKGMYFLKEENHDAHWFRAGQEDEASQLAACVGLIANTSTRTRIVRQGRDPALTIENGIGMYMDLCESKVKAKDVLS